MSDSILTALVASRDELAQFIVRLDQKEIEIRNDLDTVLGERARRQALLTDLEHVICTHDPDQANQVEVDLLRDFRQRSGVDDRTKPSILSDALEAVLGRPVPAAGQGRGRRRRHDQFALANPVVPADVPPSPWRRSGRTARTPPASSTSTTSRSPGWRVRRSSVGSRCPRRWRNSPVGRRTARRCSCVGCVRRGTTSRARRPAGCSHRRPSRRLSPPGQRPVRRSTRRR